MEAHKQKFEKSKEEFRRSMQREKEKVRRTIFLADEELPTTSKNSQRERKGRHQPRTMRKTPQNQPTPKSTSGVIKTARHFRMTVNTPPGLGCSQPSPPESTVLETPNNKETPNTETIIISEDEETAPPPPPFVFDQTAQGTQNDEISTGEEPLIRTPPPPIWDDEGLSIDDLDIDLEDLNDPLILEFCRTFWGTSDTTVDRHTPRAPSPPLSSSSSIDWENENFHPPTPPRRRGFGSLEIHDRQYPYLGMQCYERLWRARILVPKRGTALALQQPISPVEEEIMNLNSRTPRHQSQYPEVPMTPGRRWLNRSDVEYRNSAHSQPELITRSAEPLRESPVPSPPPMIALNLSPVPPAPQLTIPDNPTFDQLPLEIQREVNQLTERVTGGRLRLVREIWGCQYRITIKRGGTIWTTRM